MIRHLPEPPTSTSLESEEAGPFNNTETSPQLPHGSILIRVHNVHLRQAADLAAEHALAHGVKALGWFAVVEAECAGRRRYREFADERRGRACATLFSFANV